MARIKEINRRLHYSNPADLWKLRTELDKLTSSSHDELRKRQQAGDLGELLTQKLAKKRAPLCEAAAFTMEAKKAGAIFQNDGQVDVVATMIKASQLRPMPLVPGTAGARIRPIAPAQTADTPNAFQATGGARPNPADVPAQGPPPKLQAGAATDLDNNDRRYKDVLETIRAIQAAGPTPMFPRR